MCLSSEMKIDNKTDSDYFVNESVNKEKYECSDRSKEVKLNAHFGNYERQTDRPTDGTANGQTGSGGSFTSND